MANGAAPPPDYAEIAERLKDGTIVPFFGAGASVACGLPSARALAERLVAKASFPDEKGRDDLALVASYLVQRQDSDWLTLRKQLREALDLEVVPGRLHRCLADPRLDALRLFVTTNYDDLVERSLAPRSPWVVVDRGDPTNVWVRRHGSKWRKVEAQALGDEIGDDDPSPIVLKLHGSLDPDNRDNDSFLITEEQYVDFMGRTGGSPIPAALANRMSERSFLFLGYGLQDWNIRVLLRKLAQTRPRVGKIKSWAFVKEPTRAEVALWAAQNVEMHDVDLDDLVTKLEARL